jgi:hypothetical protein
MGNIRRDALGLNAVNFYIAVTIAAPAVEE